MCSWLSLQSPFPSAGKSTSVNCGRLLADRQPLGSTAVGVKPPNIINARMFEPREGRDRIGARVTVASSDAEVLQATNFWPRPIYARAWNFHIVRLDKPQPLPLESHSNSSKRESGADLVSA